MASAIVTERKHMEITGCYEIGGEYDTMTGECTYKVKINENGEREYIGRKDNNNRRGR